MDSAYLILLEKKYYASYGYKMPHVLAFMKTEPVNYTSSIRGDKASYLRSRARAGSIPGQGAAA